VSTPDISHGACSPSRVHDPGRLPAALTTVEPTLRLHIHHRRSTMASPLGNTHAPFSGPPYMHPFRPASAMSANRFDEGYSEDTRSQTEGDTVMRGDDVFQSDSSLGLPDWVMALSDGERSGTPGPNKTNVRSNPSQTSPMPFSSRCGRRPSPSSSRSSIRSCTSTPCCTSRPRSPSTSSRT
jgi:hypothetical protein